MSGAVRAVNPETAADALLRAGKSLILVGPPGSGKTRLAFMLVDKRGYAQQLVAGAEDLSARDLLDPVHGVAARTALLTWARYTCGKPPAWLIFDEVNRARVETILGRLFTLLDLDHRLRAPLLDPEPGLRGLLVELVRRECGEVNRYAEVLAEHVARNGLPLPLSWRMLATMNLLDMAHLHRVGYALARRAPLLPVTGEKHRVGGTRVKPGEPSRPELCENALSVLLEELPEKVRDTPPWSLLPETVVARFETPFAPLNPEAVYRRVTSPDPYWFIVEAVATRLEEIGLPPGPALYIDACRLLAANLSLNTLVLADILVATLLLPQLTFAVPRIKLELALGDTTLLEEISKLRKVIEELLGPESLSAWALRAYTASLPSLKRFEKASAV